MITAIGVALIALWVVIGFYFIDRNAEVYKTQIVALSRLSDLSKADIEADRPWEWRYDGFRNGPSYDEILFKFWRDPASFYADAPYLKETHV